MMTSQKFGSNQPVVARDTTPLRDEWRCEKSSCVVERHLDFALLMLTGTDSSTPLNRCRIRLAQSVNRVEYLSTRGTVRPGRGCW